MATAAAKRYARAVFELAQSEDTVSAWSERLERVRSLFADEDVAAVLSNPTIPRDQREAVIADTHVFDAEGTNFARLLVESGRIGQAEAIEREFQRLVDDADRDRARARGPRPSRARAVEAPREGRARDRRRRPAHPRRHEAAVRRPPRRRHCGHEIGTAPAPAGGVVDREKQGWASAPKRSRRSSRSA